MKRRLFNVLAGLSLLLCVATGIAWFVCRSIESIANAPTIEISADPYCCVALSYRGPIFLHELPDGPENVKDWPGFGFGANYDHGGRVFFVRIDYWLIIIVGTALPLWWESDLFVELASARNQEPAFTADTTSAPPPTAAQNAEQSRKKPSRLQPEPMVLIG